jgi:hypothetical protein
MPLKVKVSSKKFFILNLNNYRNAHHRVLSTAKRNYQDIFMGLDLPYRKYEQIKLHYKIYPASNRKFDLMNVICVHDKFLCDAIVKRGMLPDDNIKHMPYMPEAKVMPVDRLNPRIEIRIESFGSIYKGRLNHL